MSQAITSVSVPKEQAARPQVSLSSGPPVSFSDLVFAHFAWWRAARNGGSANAETEYHEALKRFESGHGRVVSSFWCTHLESGIALTERKRQFRSNVLTLHRETDWATKRHPEIAAQLHRCDELAIKARTVLTGVRQRICLQLVAASAGHLLSLVDSASAPDIDKEVRAALKEEQNALTKAERYYREAANGQAEIVYFAGMATVAVAVSLIAGLFLHLEWEVGVAALVAGAVGAVISVVQRINARSFHVDYDVGKPYAFFLGGLRPLIGAAFAIAIAFAFDSGMLHLPLGTTSTKDKHLALVVLAFLAGFSERWAQDTLASVGGQGAAPEPPAPKEAPAWRERSRSLDRAPPPRTRASPT